MLKIALAAGFVSLATLGLTACDVKKTQEGSVTVPKYDVEKTQSGNVTLPKYEVTPPDVKIGSIYRGIIPFLAAPFALIILLLLFPEIALWLPRALYG